MRYIKTNCLINEIAYFKLTLFLDGCMTSFVEIVRFRVDPALAEAFVSRRSEADQALVAFRGFLGSELMAGPDNSWTLIVRWASRADVEAAQAVTLASPGVPALAAWIALAQQVVSFETLELRHIRTTMRADSTDTNLQTALHFVRDGLGNAELSVFDRCLDPEIVVTTGLSPTAPIQGLEAYKAVFAGFAAAWPVSKLTIDESFATGDKVVVRFTATTIFKNDYYGVKANNKVVPLQETHTYTFRHGKIVENVVGAINLPFEFIMYPALKDAVLGALQVAP